MHKLQRYSQELDERIRQYHSGLAKQKALLSDPKWKLAAGFNIDNMSQKISVLKEERTTLDAQLNELEEKRLAKSKRRLIEEEEKDSKNESTQPNEFVF